MVGHAEAAPLDVEVGRSRRQAVTNRLAGLDDGRVLVWLLSATMVLLGVGVAGWPQFFPVSLVFPLLVVSGILLEPRPLVIVLVVTALVVLAWAPRSLLGPVRAVGVVVAVVLVMWLVLVIARSRARVGVRGLSGDRMFADLRDRIASVGQLPDLPQGWSATSCILSAHGDRFSGDFIVAHLGPGGDRLELALVDVSGKGTGAGTRSLLLSGALGGLLGAVPSSDFLRAANEYLVRQGWEEGFATAVHVDIDLGSGEYSVANAGHPAPARFTSGRGRWSILDSGGGPLLGVVAGVEFPREVGRLDRGDALLVYSDGVIETRDRGLNDGIDRMLGVAAMAVLTGDDVAREVCASARSGEDDDRAALSVRRH